VLIEKCLGRRLCSCCGKSFNVADINLPASATEPAIKMPPLNPPASCVPYLEMRSDDNYATIKRRLEARAPWQRLAAPWRMHLPSPRARVLRGRARARRAWKADTPTGVRRGRCTTRRRRRWSSCSATPACCWTLRSRAAFRRRCRGWWTRCARTRRTWRRSRPREARRAAGLRERARARRGFSRRAQPRIEPGLSRTSGGTLHARQQRVLSSVLLLRAALGPGAAPETESLGGKRRMHCSFVRRRPAVGGAAAALGARDRCQPRRGAGSAARLGPRQPRPPYSFLPRPAAISFIDRPSL